MPNLDLSAATGIRIANVDVEALRVGPYVLWELEELLASVFGSTEPAQPTCHSDADLGAWVSTQFYCPFTGPSLLGTKIVGARLYVKSDSIHIGQTWRAAIIRNPLAIVTSGSIQSSDFDTNGSKTEGDLLVAGWNELLFDEEWPGVDNGGSWNIGVQIGNGTRYLHDGSLTGLAITSPDLNFAMAEIDKRSFYNNVVNIDANWYSIDTLVEKPPSVPDPIGAFAFNGSLADAMGGSALSGTGSYETGVNGQALASNPHSRAQNVTGEASIMAWVRVESDTVADQPLFGFWDGATEAAASSYFCIYNRRVSFGPTDVLQADIRIGGSLAAITYGSRLALNQWHHVAVTHDASFMTRLYIDGVEVVASQRSGPISSATTYLVKERAGWVDNLRSYDVALTAEQIAYLMVQPV